MIHELLLCLAGHQSSLLKDNEIKNSATNAFPLLSHCESDLLATVKNVAITHSRIRDDGSRISISHSSTICRAVASAIISTQLSLFQQDILELERNILIMDGNTVGAYKTVPLALIASQFTQWTRLLDWLLSILYYMTPSEGKNRESYKQGEGSTRSSGAGIMNKLRQEGQTGYPEIEKASLALQKVAETAWLRQMSGWVLYGRLPSTGRTDFFIQKTENIDDGTDTFHIDNNLLPRFVSKQTASSILFIGKSLDLVRKSESATGTTKISTISDAELLPRHLQHLSTLQIPLSSSALSEATAEIRFSLCRTKLQQLLPLSKILEVLILFQKFFLLGQGGFAVSLIMAADEHLRLRHNKHGYHPQGEGHRGPTTPSVTEGEAVAVLTRAWANLYVEEQHYDEIVDQARNLIRLSKSHSLRPGTPVGTIGAAETRPKLSPVAFNDFLFSTPISLIMDIKSPLDIFVSSSDLEMYSAINSYLLAVRRGHLHVTDLWRQTSLRKIYPAPSRWPHNASGPGKSHLQSMRERHNRRALEMRKVWASCTAAAFLLSEIGAYFEYEVVGESWKVFEAWITQPTSAHGNEQISKLAEEDDQKYQGTMPTDPTPWGTSYGPQDPETLSNAHSQFLTSLSQALFLTDVVFTGTLRSLLRDLDELAAHVNRLHTVQDILDLEEDEGVVQGVIDYVQERQKVVLELDRARKKMDSDMKKLVARLRALDEEITMSGQLLEPKNYEQFGNDDQIRTAKSLDRLLMKLDFGN